MTRLGVSILFTACVLVPAVRAQVSEIQFDGEIFVRQFTKAAPEAGMVAEYIRPGETVKNWTRLIAIRHFPNLKDTKSAAAGLAKTVQQHNPRARFQILAGDDGTEAQVDFLTWVPGRGTHGEFNIHRYRKVEGYPGVISYQFAYRFSPKDRHAIGVFKERRERWIREMTAAEFAIGFRR